MKRYVLEAWLLLLAIDIAKHLVTFEGFRGFVAKRKTRKTSPTHSPSVTGLCRAVDAACALYFKPAMCLQRSAATVWLLRRHGWGARLVIGATIAPFRSHAWVEVEDHVVNDKASTVEAYRVLARC